MKPLLLLALLLLFLLSFPCSAQSVKTKYDKFRDETTFYIEPQFVEMKSQPMEVSFYIGHKGQTPQREGMIVGMAVYSSSRNWRFLDDDNLIVMADGKRIEIGKPISRDSKLVRYGVEESLAYKLSESDLIAISHASRVEMQIGFIEFSFRDKLRGKLRELVTRLPK